MSSTMEIVQSYIRAAWPKLRLACQTMITNGDGPESFVIMLADKAVFKRMPPAFERLVRKAFTPAGGDLFFSVAPREAAITFVGKLFPESNLAEQLSIANEGCIGVLAYMPKSVHLSDFDAELLEHEVMPKARFVNGQWLRDTPSAEARPG